MTRFGLVAVAICLVLGLSAGCGSDKSTEPEPTLDPFPASSTPEGAVKRFVAVYNAMDSTEFARLLTEDFTFEFSNATDPDLVAQFATGWVKDDEIISARNLFQGGVNSSGLFQPRPNTIDLDFLQSVTRPDTIEGRDSTYYRVLLTPITLTIDVPPRPGETEGTTFLVGAGGSPSVQRFFFVRGDEAQLEPGQPADSLHWYLWRWRDESTPQLKPHPGSRLGPLESNEATWGQVKAFYR